MRKKGVFLALVSGFVLLGQVLAAGRVPCGTMELFRRRAQNDPAELLRKQDLERSIGQWIQSHAAEKNATPTITIPVVVHVVWNTSPQNISDAQIRSQIDRLNLDYRKLNTDMLASNHPFYNLAGDAGVEFCLASIDPNGLPTTGIERRHTNVSSFTDDDAVKDTASGGMQAWDATQYLNIWVCKLSGDLLGYAQFPSDLATYPETDGVVVGYSNFGTMGTATAPYNLGRTATHEIGHWLNLEHIWGDDEGTANECAGTDDVNDTPNQQLPTYDCLTGTHTDSCSTSYPGFMYENYMDYTPDACMVMFTKGQVARMQAVFNLARQDILSSNKCAGATYVNTSFLNTLRVYPNPVENYLAIEGLPKSGNPEYTVEIYNVLGEKVFTSPFSSSDKLLEIHGLKTGTYVLTIFNDQYSATQKITVVK